MADAAAARRKTAPRVLAAGILVILGSCSPTGPTPPKPPVVGPATPPIIRSITVPTSRIEAGTDVAITAVVEDAETPLAQLAYQWTASAGTITGSGATATWQIPRGLKSGVDVVIALTVVDTYDAVVNNVVVKQQFAVGGASSAFRVHDSEAEVKELARKFLVDLFGNTNVPPEACLVDFADICAHYTYGRIAELEDIVGHRRDVVLTKSEMLNQDVRFFAPTFGAVHSAMQYTGHPTISSEISSDCHDFEVTVVYVGNRWWICESTHHPDDRSFCPAGANSGELGRILRKILDRGKGGGGGTR